MRPLAHLSRKALVPPMITAATLSMAGGGLLAVLSFMQMKMHSRRSHTRGMLVMLIHLGLADAVFASSFLIAQLPTGAWSPNGGAACSVGSVLNECGSLVTSLLIILFAWQLYNVSTVSEVTIILDEADEPAHQGWTPTQRAHWLCAIAWLLPLVVEALLWYLVYFPQDAMGPQVLMPWCHWKHALVGWSLLQYSVTGLAMVYSAIIYLRVCALSGICSKRNLRGSRSAP